MTLQTFIRHVLFPAVLLLCLAPAMAISDTPLQSSDAPQVMPAPAAPDETRPRIFKENPPSPNPGEAGARADIHDIKPVIAPKSLPMATIWIAATALILILLLLLGRHLWHRRKGGSEIPTLTPELPPEESARLALNALAAERLVDGRRFYFRLSEILRRYLFERYAIGAPEMTPEELQPLVTRLNLPGGQLGVLNSFWSHSEPVKFAGRTAMETEMAADLKQIRSFVEITTEAVRLEEAAAGLENNPQEGPPPPPVQREV